MNRVSFSWQPLAIAGAFSLLHPACSGQTGSVDIGIPEYDSGSVFDPGTGGSLGTDAGGEGCEPQVEESADRLIAEHQGLAVVLGVLTVLPPEYGVPQRVVERGLLVIDTSGEQPRVLSELALEGTPLFLGMQPGSALVVVRRGVSLDRETLPDAYLPSTQDVLVRIDLGDPESPRIIDETTLDGEVRSVRVEGQCLLALSRVRDPAPICQENGILLDGPTECRSVELRVQSYALGADVEAVAEVGFDDVYRSFAGPDFYALTEQSYEGQQTLSLAQLSDGDCGVRAGAVDRFSGPVQAVGVSGDALAVVARQDGQVEASVFDVADEPVARGSVALPDNAAKIDGLPNGAGFVVDFEQPAPSVWLDVSDATAPGVVTLSSVVATLPIENRVLGVAPGDEGNARWTLFGVDAQGAPLVLDQLDTTWPFQQQVGVSTLWRLHEGRGIVAYPFFVGGEARMGILDVVSDDLAVVTEHPAPGYGPASGVGAGFVAVYEGVLASLPADPERSASELELLERTPAVALDELVVDGDLVRLVREGDRVFVEVGAETSLELEHYATELLAANGRVVALGLRRPAECDIDGFVELVCPEPNRAGISVIRLGDEPEVTESFELPSDYDAPGLPEDASFDAYWSGYLELEPGRWLLPVRRTIRCNTQAACDELGLVAYEGFGAPGCSEDCENADQTPFVSHSGSERRHWLYLLDLSDGAAPRLEVAADLSGELDLADEGPLDLAGVVLRTDGALGFPRQQDLYDERGNSLPNEHGQSSTRFYVELLRVDQGSFSAVESINTPGLPVALGRKGSEVWSVEPRWLSDERIDAWLFRSAVQHGGAFIAGERNLGPGFRQAEATGRFLAVMTGPVGCASEPVVRLEVFDLNATELSPTSSLELDGPNWGFARFEQPWSSDLLLTGGPAPRGFLELSVDEGVLAVERYYTR